MSNDTVAVGKPVYLRTAEDSDWKLVTIKYWSEVYVIVAFEDGSETAFDANDPDLQFCTMGTKEIREMMSAAGPMPLFAEKLLWEICKSLYNKGYRKVEVDTYA